MSVTWPGMLNGQIPRDQMINVVNATDRPARDGDFMNPAAGYWFKRMQADCLRDVGKTFGTEEAYRSLETQILYAGPNSPLPKGTAVAPAGTSKHGWGRANDITRYNDPDIWAWLMAHEDEYGFSWEEGRNSNEKWHHVFVGSLDTTGLNLEEDDMFNDNDRYSAKLTLESQARVEQGNYAIKRWLKEDGPASVMGKLDLILYLLQGNKATDPSIKKLVNEIHDDVVKSLDALDKK